MTSKKLAALLGSLLVLASLYFIGQQLWAYRESLSDWRPTSLAFLSLSAAIAIYALANYCLSNAWIRLLGLAGEQGLQPLQLTRIYGKSQIGKYVPGNVMHIAGRHVMAKARGLSHHGLAMAAIYEILGLLTAASLIALIGIGFSPMDIPQLRWLPWLVPLVLGAYLLSPRLLRLFHHEFPLISAISMLAPLARYLLFFIAAGMGLLLITWAETGTSLHLSSLILLSAFAIAWTLGFITPGAPSGIGIREAIMVLLLTPLTGKESALIISLLFRLVTVGGDLLFLVLTNPRRSYGDLDTKQANH